MKQRRFERVELHALPGIPMVDTDDDLVAITLAALQRMDMVLVDHDILVYAQKLISKVEGRLVDLRTLVPSERAVRIAKETGKDPRLVELILSESRRIVRSVPGLIIVEHRLGFVLANAGIDQSNVIEGNDGSYALPLPLDPDVTAERLRAELCRRTGVRIAVLINDSFGRAWRLGTTGTAIGCAGLPALLDLRGEVDLTGRTLQATVVGFADEIAAAASLVMGQAGEGQPVVLVRGIAPSAQPCSARSLVRPPAEDLFR